MDGVPCKISKISCHSTPKSSLLLASIAASLKSSWNVTAVYTVESTLKIVVLALTRAIPKERQEKKGYQDEKHIQKK